MHLTGIVLQTLLGLSSLAAALPSTRNPISDGGRRSIRHRDPMPGSFPRAAFNYNTSCNTDGGDGDGDDYSGGTDSGSDDDDPCDACSSGDHGDDDDAYWTLWNMNITIEPDCLKADYAFFIDILGSVDPSSTCNENATDPSAVDHDYHCFLCKFTVDSADGVPANHMNFTDVDCGSSAHFLISGGHVVSDNGTVTDNVVLTVGQREWNERAWFGYDKWEYMDKPPFRTKVYPWP